MRVALCVVALHLSGAPLQCRSEPDFEERRYETPAEALYRLAEEFQTKGDEAAWRSTLEHLIRRYPSSRFAVMAKSDLAESQ